MWMNSGLVQGSLWQQVFFAFFVHFGTISTPFLMCQQVRMMVEIYPTETWHQKPDWALKTLRLAIDG